MVSSIDRLAIIALSALALAFLPVLVSAQVDSTTTGAEVFPDSTAVYLQLNDGGKLLDALLNHPAREKIEKIDGYRKLMSSPQMMGVQFVTSIIEGQLKQSWQEAVRNVTANVYLCVDLETSGVALLMRANDEAQLKRTAGTLLGWIRSEAESAVTILLRSKCTGMSKSRILTGRR